MESSVIAMCSCDCPFQDARYGKRNRVKTLAKPDGGGKQEHRCTVCGPKARWEQRIAEHAKSPLLKTV